MIPLPPDILRRISALPNGLEVLTIFADFLELVVTPPTVTKTRHALRQDRYRERHTKRHAERHETLQKGSPDGSPNAMSPAPPKDITPSLTPSQNPPESTKRARARRTGIAEDQLPGDQEIDFANSYGLRGQRFTDEWAQFRDHHRKCDSRMADWPATWRTWVRRVGRYQASGPAGRSNGQMEAIKGFFDDTSGREERAGEAISGLLPDRR